MSENERCANCRRKRPVAVLIRGDPWCGPCHEARLDGLERAAIARRAPAARPHQIGPVAREEAEAVRFDAAELAKARAAYEAEVEIQKSADREALKAGLPRGAFAVEVSE